MSNNDETHDSYAVVSELTDDDDFLKVWEKEGNETFVELPKEDDGTILLATLQGQFPNAVGLKYLSSSGGWRGVRITDDALNPPHGGWGDANYYVTLQKADSAKAKPAAKESDLEEELLQDLFVLRLPKDITDEDLRDYFTEKCGEMHLHEVKYDRVTGKSRGFGFIRFKTVEAAKKALEEEHVINDQKLEVRISRKKEVPCQLFIGRLPVGTTKEDLYEYFSQYGELTEAYTTTPFRGFGFVTYSSTDIARSILRLTHEIRGKPVNVAIAEPKQERGARGRYDSGRRDSYRDSDSRRREFFDDHRERARHDRRYDPRRSRRDSPPRSHDMLNEFKDMLVNILHQRR